MAHDIATTLGYAVLACGGAFFIAFYLRAAMSSSTVNSIGAGNAFRPPPKWFWWVTGATAAVTFGLGMWWLISGTDSTVIPSQKTPPTAMPSPPPTVPHSGMPTAPETWESSLGSAFRAWWEHNGWFLGEIALGIAILGVVLVAAVVMFRRPDVRSSLGVLLIVLLALFIGWWFDNEHVVWGWASRGYVPGLAELGAYIKSHFLPLCVIALLIVLAAWLPAGAREDRVARGQWAAWILAFLLLAPLIIAWWQTPVRGVVTIPRAASLPQCRFTPDHSTRCQLTEEWSAPITADRPTEAGEYLFCVSTPVKDGYEARKTGPNTWRLRSKQGDLTVTLDMLCEPAVCPQI